MDVANFQAKANFSMQSTTRYHHLAGSVGFAKIGAIKEELFVRSYHIALSHVAD